MHTCVSAITAVVLGISAASVHGYSGRDTLSFGQALAEFEPQILHGPTRDVGSEWSSRAKKDSLLIHSFEVPGTDVNPAARKLLQDQVTTAVTDPSPPNKTTTTYEIEKLCPEIKSGPHLCDTGSWRITGGAVITYNMTIPESELDLALQVTLQPSSGDPDMVIFLLDEFSRATVQDHSMEFAGHDVASVDARFLPEGIQVAIQVRAQRTEASFSLTVDLFEEGRQVSQRDAKALAAISAACCGNGTCTSPIFTQYAADQTVMNPCQLPNWYCNAAGHLTHVILLNEGFQCKAVDLQPLALMTSMHVFALVNAPGVTGDINTFLGHFKGDHGLRVLDLVVTGMTGMLPEKCPAGHQFGKLARLQLDDMRISGHIPDCLLALEDLHIARTNIHEALPAIPADSPMRRLSLIQMDDDKPRITGDAAAIGRLGKLQAAILTYTDFRGTLTIGPDLREVTTIGLPFTKFAAASQLRLEAALMVDGALAGAVPPELLNDSDMQHLVLRNNSLTSMQADFASMKMRLLDVSFNDIEGALPSAFGTQPSLLYIAASHNKFSGPIDKFTRLLDGSNIVHYFDIAANQLTGPLSGLEPLAALANVGIQLVHPDTGTRLPNVINASANNFEGSLPLSYFADASSGGPDRLPLVLIDIRGNELMACPDPDITSTMVQVLCDRDAPERGLGLGNADTDVIVSTVPAASEERAAPAGDSALGAGALAGIVVAVVAAALIAAAVAAVALRRYKQQKLDAWTAATLDQGATTSSAAIMGYRDPAIP